MGHAYFSSSLSWPHMYILIHNSLLHSFPPQKYFLKCYILHNWVKQCYLLLRQISKLYMLQLIVSHNSTLFISINTLSNNIMLDWPCLNNERTIIVLHNVVVLHTVESDKLKQYLLFYILIYHISSSLNSLFLLYS